MHTSIAVVLLSRHAEIHGFPDPRGRFHGDVEIFRNLPSGILRNNIYTEYETHFFRLSQARVDNENKNDISEILLTLSAFLKVW